jgi:hypothetical protein
MNITEVIDMSNAKFTVNSKLMQNYETGTPIDYHNAIAATSDGDGNLLFFSIGDDGRIYAFSPANNTPTGWQRTDLNQGMDDFTAVLLAAEQDEKGAPLLAAVMQSKSTREYSVFFTKDFAATTGKDRWVFRGRNGGVDVTDIAVGHGKDGAVLIVVTTRQGDQSTNFIVNPDLTDQSWIWREVPSPINSQRVISTAIGHNSRIESLDEAQGLLYSLYQTGDGGQTWMVITSLPDFTFYSHAIPLDFNPTAFGVTRGAQGDTELIVGDKTLYRLSPELQMSRDDDQVKREIEPITSQPAAYDIKSVEVGVMQNGLLEAWFLTEDGKLSRTYQGADGKWVSPLPFQAQVGEMAAWRNADKNLHEVFTVDLNNGLRRYRQDPTTTLWKGFDIMVESLDTCREIKTYVTQLQITDQNGAPMANQKVTVRASELTPLTINHSVYYADISSDAVVCETDALGNLTIVNKVEGLSTPTLRLQADALGSQLIDVDPAAEVRQMLSNITIEQLQNAQTQTDAIGVTKPIFAGKGASDLEGAQQALQQLMSLGAQLPSQNGFKPQGLRSASAGFVTHSAGTPMLNRVAYGALPSGYRWGLDFTGARPVFTTDQKQIESAHLAKLSGDTSVAALSARSVLDDAEHLFGDVLRAIEGDLIDASHWVVQKVNDGLQIIINTKEKAYQVVIKYAEQVLPLVQYVLQKVGAFFEQLAGWLGPVFAWKDILRAHDVIRTVVNHGFDKFVAELTNAEDYIHGVFTELKKRIIGSDLAGQAGSLVQGDVKSLYTTGGYPPPLNSPDVSWALSHVTSGNLIRYGDATPPTVSSSISQSVRQDIDQLKTLFNSAALDFVQGKISQAEFLGRIIEALEVAVLDTVETAALGMVEVVKLVVDAIKDILNVEWKIPLIAPLYADITGGAKLTLLDLISLLAAIPATALYKQATNEAPFTESVAKALTQTKNMDELLGTFVSLDRRPAPRRMAAVNRASVARASFSAVATESEEQQNTGNPLPPGARYASYVFNFAIVAPWIINGLINGVMVSQEQKQLPAGDKVKLVSGLIVNVLSIVPMALTLGYAEQDSQSEDDLPRLRYEMFITTFQILFNVKDGLMAAWRATEEDMVTLDPILDFFESVLGAFNLGWAISLALAEKAQKKMDTNNGLKLTQNIASSVSQILAFFSYVAKEPISKDILASTQVLLGVAPGFIGCIRTVFDIQNNEMDLKN